MDARNASTPQTKLQSNADLSPAIKPLFSRL